MDKNYFTLFIRRHKIGLATGILLALCFWFSLPRPLFDVPLSIVLEDKNEQLLGARIAKDGQWRFPYSDSIPQKFEQALLTFEDRRFYRHWGVDIRGLVRAISQNAKAGKRVSGGSTITMQVIRMARNRKRRSIWNKLVEMVLAFRLEMSQSKAQILIHYTANAPFGGNVVGLEAASWRYFGKQPELLSWAEAATLAVLPNSPSLIHPNRNRQALLEKRNRLLKRLHEQAKIDAFTYELALEEPLPDAPLPLPQLAPHLLDRLALQKNGQKQARFKSTLELHFQQMVGEVIEKHHRQLKNNFIHNAAVVVADIETGAILAYVGNVKGTGAENQEFVDIIPAPRSTGSVIKPLLYAAMLDEGSLLPSSLVPDIPSQMGGYKPENFLQQYDGMVSAKRALTRSLNIPIILLLQEYGLEKFHFKLQQLNFKTIKKPPNHYGLTLVVGGAEATLQDITSVYASMARTLLHYAPHNGTYNANHFRDLHYLVDAPLPKEKWIKNATHFKASSIWLTFDAMREVERPNSEGEWQRFNSGRRVAWKTGTSYGFRDAWAVGVDTRYAVGVWVGNADGEGRPGLIGVHTAAPILFEVFNQLPRATHWFDPPYDDMAKVPVCAQSGYLPTSICPIDTLWGVKTTLRLKTCTYHQMLHLDSTKTWQVHSQCEAPNTMIHQPWFVLPPVEEHYFKSKHPSYKIPPSFRSDCASDATVAMQLIYPKNFAKIYLPVDFDGKLSSTVFSVAHRSTNQLIHWHLDENYIGTTQHFHRMALQPQTGVHLLTLVDEQGNRLERTFEILTKSK